MASLKGLARRLECLEATAGEEPCCAACGREHVWSLLSLGALAGDVRRPLAPTCTCLCCAPALDDIFRRYQACHEGEGPWAA